MVSFICIYIVKMFTLTALCSSRRFLIAHVNLLISKLGLHFAKNKQDKDLKVRVQLEFRTLIFSPMCSKLKNSKQDLFPLVPAGQ